VSDITTDEKILFKDLSIGLKIPIVLAWIFGVFEALAFIIGFIIGVLS